MNALLIAAVLGAWPTLPDPATMWPSLPPIVAVVETPPVPAPVATAWPDLGDHDPSSDEEELTKPVPTETPAEPSVWETGPDGRIVRLPGSRVPWPHQGCLMCLGIHLERTHRVPMSHLQKYGRDQWDTIHCNFHNKPKAQSVAPATGPPLSPPAIVPPPKLDSKSGSGCPGGVCPSPAAATWKATWRRRFR